MRIAAIAEMTPPMPDFTASFVRIDQRPARRTTGCLLALLIGFAVVLVSPFYLVASAALATVNLGEAASVRPIASAQIVTGLAFWLILLGFPIYRLLDTLTRSRSIEIAADQFTIHDRVFGRATSWSAPLAEFVGLAPYLRASLSGVRHELILVHPERQKSILVAMAPRLLQSDVDHIVAALGLEELAPQALRYRDDKKSI